jgi:hypothetical protein
MLFFPGFSQKNFILSAFACVRMGGETFQEKDIFGISKGKYSNFCFCSGKAPLRNKNSALKNGGGFSLTVWYYVSFAGFEVCSAPAKIYHLLCTRLNCHFCFPLPEVF